MLPAGSTLLVYTDGLVESREHDIDQGIDALSDILAQSHAAITMSELAHRIAAEVGPSAEGDDQCLLLVRVE